MQVILSDEEYRKIGEKENSLKDRILELEDELNSKEIKENEKYLTFDKVEIMYDREPIEEGKAYEDIIKERQKKVICNGKEWYMFCHKSYYTDWLSNESIEEKVISISNGFDKERLVLMHFDGNNELMVLAFNNLRFELVEE
jgi:hypothetical protein